MYEIFSELNRVGSGASSTPERGPVLLLLGGGMAAGKSTVREVIGHDDFWSKVGASPAGLSLTAAAHCAPFIHRNMPWSMVYVMSLLALQWLHRPMQVGVFVIGPKWLYYCG